MAGLHTAIITAISLIGTLHCCSSLAALLGQIWLYRPQLNQLNRYVGANKWALVTGASDGIGKAFAEEFCAHGFNIILHGRNRTKLETVRDELSSRCPSCQIQLLVIDASDIEGLRAKIGQVLHLNITVLVNNVGGGPAPIFVPFASRTVDDIEAWINTSARFTTEITRMLVSKMIRNQPGLILNIGSGASGFACPYIAVYNGTKSYLQSWSRSLSLEMKNEKHDIEVLHYRVGLVQSNTARRETSLLVPSPKKFAKHALSLVGRGHYDVWGYWPHAIQFGLIGTMPSLIRDRIISNMAIKEMADERRSV